MSAAALVNRETFVLPQPSNWWLIRVGNTRVCAGNGSAGLNKAMRLQGWWRWEAGLSPGQRPRSQTARSRFDPRHSRDPSRRPQDRMPRRGRTENLKGRTLSASYRGAARPQVPRVGSRAAHTRRLVPPGRVHAARAGTPPRSPRPAQPSPLTQGRGKVGNPGPPQGAWAGGSPGKGRSPPAAPIVWLRPPGPGERSPDVPAGSRGWEKWLDSGGDPARAAGASAMSAALPRQQPPPAAPAAHPPLRRPTASIALPAAAAAPLRKPGPARRGHMLRPRLGRSDPRPPRPRPASPLNRRALPRGLESPVSFRALQERSRPGRLLPLGVVVPRNQELITGKGVGIGQCPLHHRRGWPG